MSIVAMNWAWRQGLSPTLKLVLMALADASDDQGVCWPSVPTLARKCTVSTRTVQRALRTLVDQNLLIAEPRHRRDGSSTSNRYRLRMGRGDNLSPGHEPDAAPAGQARQGETGGAVAPGTTMGPFPESPRPRGREGRPADSVAADSGSGHCFPLEYPKGLSPSERTDAQGRLSSLPPELAQWLLDELAARLEAGTIRVSPLAYLAGLIKRAEAGVFRPEAALRVADMREQRRRQEAALKRLQARTGAVVSGRAPVETPLAKRLEEIRVRDRKRGEGR